MLNAITQRGVLILGRFRDGGLQTLGVIADGLRAAGYLPITFDFDRPTARTYTETVTTLVGLSRFVVVDLSGPSVPQELMATVERFKVPFVPVIEKGRKYPSMIVDFLEHDWVLKPVLEFANLKELADAVPARIAGRAEERQARRQKLLDELYGGA